MTSQSPFSRRNIYVALTAPAIAYIATKTLLNLIAATSTTASKEPSTKPHIHLAPSTRMLTPQEEDQIPYPPDALPGGRNVATPHGNLRIYEWGPSNGRKILFVHGISTPCIALAKMAKLLVRKGCRVMLFDLPGRGYSDCADPRVQKQDEVFFCGSILSVLASAEGGGNWMKEGFTLVGYSLGGGISAAFTSYYPELVNSLVLIAPGGILRRGRLTLASRILYGDVLPDAVVEFLVGRQLKGGRRSKPMAKVRVTKSTEAQGGVDVTDAVQEELPEDDPYAPGQDSCSPIFDDRPSISPAAAVAWQLDAHPGFIPAFISSLKYAPIHDGRERWSLIGKRCEAARKPVESDEVLRPTGLQEGKVLLVLGLSDNIITHEETVQDATEALGADNIKAVKLKGGHDVTISNANGCVDAMMDFWGEV